jgi:hypothetical protein
MQKNRLGVSLFFFALLGEIATGAAHPRNDNFLECALFGNVSLQLGNGDANLLHGIAVTDGDTVIGGSVLIAHGLEVHSDAQRCADFVLTAVTLTDRTGIVKINIKVFGKLGVNFARFVRELFRKGKHSSLKGRKSRV